MAFFGINEKQDIGFGHGQVERCVSGIDEKRDRGFGRGQVVRGVSRH